MKICPFCNETIEDEKPFCSYCNKPLISGLRSARNMRLRQEFNVNKSNPSNSGEEYESYEDIIVSDDEIEDQIKNINLSLERQELSGNPIQGALLLEKSSLYYKKRDLPNALKILELAQKNFEGENNLISMAICYNEIGLIQEDLGFFDQAIYQFNRSLEILKSCNDFQKELKVLNNLGNVYYLIKDVEQSYKYYQEALNLAKQKELIFEEVKTSSNLVEILYILQDFDRIKRILERNSEFFKANEDLYGVVATHIRFGKMYYLEGKNYDEAYERMNRALELIDSVKENLSLQLKAKLEWECFLYIGKLQLLWDNNVDAENFLLQSLEAVRIFEFGDNIKEGEILEELANLYSKKKNTERELEYYNLAYEIFYKYGNNAKCADLKVKIALLYSNSEKNKSRAVQYYEEALNLYEDLGYIKEAAILLNKLGDYYISKGLSELAISNFEKARDYYKELQNNYNFNLINEKIKSLIKENSFSEI
ncbi:hypothetical protein LCGC14_0468250 [marine sediment metagenome]|uniref:MalT-like TPR region domain-containing protein n=1 Tax=marine sediment metagenome TaxID=412755 RepID=A0A0F9VM00_9ZZZZ|nr:MAG: Tetratricopeptide repeat protein [Candidatus Lokiarchaeum sp. GC14_75]HEC41136.1 hypothetical protein [bacterium]